MFFEEKGKKKTLRRQLCASVKMTYSTTKYGSSRKIVYI